MNSRPVFNASWVVHAPSYHPVCHIFAFVLLDVVTLIEGEERPMKARDDMTHELTVWTMYEDRTVTPYIGKLLPGAHTVRALGGRLIEPANHAYQWSAQSNNEAEARVEEIMTAVGDGKLSPTPDWRVIWDDMYKDWVSVKGLVYGN